MQLQRWRAKFAADENWTRENLRHINKTPTLLREAMEGPGYPAEPGEEKRPKRGRGK